MEGVLDLPESGKRTFDNVLTSPSADSQTPKQHKYDIAQLFDRLDSIQASLNNNTVSVSVLMNDMKDVKSSIKGTLELAADVSDLKTQNEYLSDRVDILEGRIASQSDQIKDLANAVEEITYRSMRDNLIINNLPEQGQGTEDCDTLVYDFIRNKLRVPNDQIFSRENPHAPVKIDVSHRFPRMGAQTKPMVVKFTMRSGRDVCLKFAKNLKGTGIYITDQLPKSMSQRKQAQMPKFKDLKAAGKNAYFNKDKLMLDKRPVDPLFTKNPLPLSSKTIDIAPKLDSYVIGESVEGNNSGFTAIAVKVPGIKEAQAAFSKCHKFDDVIKSTSAPYAYRVPEGFGYSDNGEFGAGKVLSDILENSKMTDIFVIVPRTLGQPNFGKTSHANIKGTIRDCLKKLAG